MLLHKGKIVMKTTDKVYNSMWRKLVPNDPEIAGRDKALFQVHRHVLIHTWKSVYVQLYERVKEELRQ